MLLSILVQIVSFLKPSLPTLGQKRQDYNRKTEELLLKANLQNLLPQDGKKERVPHKKYLSSTHIYHPVANQILMAGFSYKY